MLIRDGSTHTLAMSQIPHLAATPVRQGRLVVLSSSQILSFMCLLFCESISNLLQQKSTFFFGLLSNPDTPRPCASHSDVSYPSCICPSLGSDSLPTYFTCTTFSGFLSYSIVQF